MTARGGSRWTEEDYARAAEAVAVYRNRFTGGDTVFPSDEGSARVALDSAVFPIGEPDDERPEPRTEVARVLWRTGRKVGCHLYAQLGPGPSDDDPPIGTLFTDELATLAVQGHNAAVAAVRAAGEAGK